MLSPIPRSFFLISALVSMLVACASADNRREPPIAAGLGGGSGFWCRTMSTTFASKGKSTVSQRSLGCGRTMTECERFTPPRPPGLYSLPSGDSELDSPPTCQQQPSASCFTVRQQGVQKTSCAQSLSDCDQISKLVASSLGQSGDSVTKCTVYY